ncbi:MAG: GSCFA domain-containing protein [Thermaurantimonas sp.]|uniref:GSCFA domain-containing protein n=1 Tax=Thermaurantimonas sp. TaxID=2681568 RepID=UPI00391C1951
MTFQHRILSFPAVETPIDLLNVKDGVILLGSCFSENIGSRLQRFYHPVIVNPLGIAFDPVSLLKHLKQAFSEAEEDTIFERDGIYLSWQHHSSLYAVSKEALKQKIKEASNVLKKSVLEARLIVITLGTAYHYVLKKNQLSVANCHKMPSDIFEKRLLAPKDVEGILEEVLALIAYWNKNASVILTVSPVKHLRDGMVQNIRSKAHLLAAVHAVVDRHNHVFYFPSYEIITDVLRNYEYYEDDMAHPTQKAIDVVFEYFVNTWFSEDTKKCFERIDQFLKNLNHHIRMPEAESARKWFMHLKNEKENLQKELNLELNNADEERWKKLEALFERQ